MELPVIFRSHSRNARVSFPQQQYGLEMGKDGIDRPYEDALFRDGMLEVKKSNRSLLERLRNHSGCAETAGDSIDKNKAFWEDPEQVVEMAHGVYAVPAVSPKEGVGKDLENALKHLSDLPNVLSPAIFDKTLNALYKVMDAFQIKGITRPGDDVKPANLIARANLALEILEENKLWAANDGKRAT
jgi:hypothetical protein